MKIYAIAACAILAACTQASPVMNAGDGTYFVSTRAAPAAGGTTGAYSRAHEEATKFCAARGGEPILVGAEVQNVYQSAYGGAASGNRYGWGGGYSGSMNAWGSAGMRFRCA